MSSSRISTRSFTLFNFDFILCITTIVFGLLDLFIINMVSQQWAIMFIIAGFVGLAFSLVGRLATR